jgi:hypothetical protein
VLTDENVQTVAKLDLLTEFGDLDRRLELLRNTDWDAERGDRSIARSRAGSFALP